MTLYTLTFVFKNDHVLLIDSNKFPGKMNGIGGKVAEGERIDETVIRHLREEAGVIMKPELNETDQFFQFGQLKCENCDDWSKNYIVYLFSVFLTDDNHDPIAYSDPKRERGWWHIESPVLLRRSLLAPRVAALVPLAYERIAHTWIEE